MNNISVSGFTKMTNANIRTKCDMQR